MLTISGTSLCTQDALNPSTAQPSTAHYCLEELKLFFWWFKWWIASGAGLMYPHRQKFLSPPSPLALVPVFFLHLPNATAKLAFSFRLVGVIWAAQAATAADRTDRQNHIKTDTTANGFHSNALKLHFLYPQWSFSELFAANKLLPQPLLLLPFEWPLSSLFLSALPLILSPCSFFLLVRFHMWEYSVFH